MSRESLFYVYALVDPRNGLPFYIGKGKKARAWSHTNEAASGRSTNRAKAKLITEIVALGLSVIVQIIDYHPTEAGAFDHEIELIAATAGLTNIRRGGEGWALSAQEAEKRLAGRELVRQNLKAIKTHDWLVKWVAEHENWTSAFIPGVKNGEALGAEYLKIVRELVKYPRPVLLAA